MTTKLSQYENIMQKYPNKIPIIVNKYDNNYLSPRVFFMFNLNLQSYV